jgi:hypothetical protein
MFDSSISCGAYSSPPALMAMPAAGRDEDVVRFDRRRCGKNEILEPRNIRGLV